MKVSAQVVLINEEGLVLGVSRKTDHNDFGLPGGKMDPEDLSIEAAALREVKEETGLNIYDLELVFAMHKQGYMGYTYLAKYSGEINHKEPHVVKWVPFQVIMQGSFGRFNELVSESLDDMGIEYQKKIDLAAAEAELKIFVESTVRKGYLKPFRFKSLTQNGYIQLDGDYNEEFMDNDEEYEKKLVEIGEKYHLKNVKFPYYYWMK